MAVETHDAMLSTQFKALTGSSPFLWQSRLIEEHLRPGDIRLVGGLSTGPFADTVRRE